MTHLHSINKLEFTGDHTLLAQELEDIKEHVKWQLTAFRQVLYPVQGLFFEMD